VIDGKRVVCFTPWGREITASLLYKYLKRDHERGTVDEWQLWENTDAEQVGDRAYAEKLAAENDWITYVQYPDDPKLRVHPKQLNTGTFYKLTQDVNSVYVRFDDDIVWIDENAIERLVRARIQNPAPFVVFPLIWNNAVCSYYLQQGEQMPSWWGKVSSNNCMDPVGWADPLFAEGIHRHLLAMIDAGEVDSLFMHHSIQLPLAHQFSVSCFAQNGEEYQEFNGVRGEEEAWHTIVRPYETGRSNIIVPNALVSHFSFYHQRDYLFTTDLLDQYRALADAL
jgi:hypothetical protein